MTLGILAATLPGRPPFQYAFTPSDVVWLGRLLASDVGRRYGHRRALVWRAFARFANSGGGTSFTEFLQRAVPSLPREPWNQLPQGARRLAFAAATGALRRRSLNPTVYVVPRGYAGSQPYAYPSAPYGWQGEEEMEGPSTDTPATDAGGTASTATAGAPAMA